MNNTRLKLVSLLLAADMALTFCPVSAFAASSGGGYNSINIRFSAAGR